jgi:hypothetical protein
MDDDVFNGKFWQQTHNFEVLNLIHRVFTVNFHKKGEYDQSIAIKQHFLSILYMTLYYSDLTCFP